jgi:hypothetical protein
MIFWKSRTQVPASYWQPAKEPVPDQVKQLVATFSFFLFRSRSMETDPLIRQWITRALDLTVILSGTKFIGAAISKQSINDFCNSRSHMKRCPISNTPYNCLTFSVHMILTL